jgi:hypothetical protein
MSEIKKELELVHHWWPAEDIKLEMWTLFSGYLYFPIKERFIPIFAKMLHDLEKEGKIKLL